MASLTCTGLLNVYKQFLYWFQYHEKHDVIGLLQHTEQIDRKNGLNLHRKMLEKYTLYFLSILYFNSPKDTCRAHKRTMHHKRHMPCTDRNHAAQNIHAVHSQKHAEQKTHSVHRQKPCSTKNTWRARQISCSTKDTCRAQTDVMQHERHMLCTDRYHVAQKTHAVHRQKPCNAKDTCRAQTDII